MSPLLLTTTARPEQPRPVFADLLPPSCRTVCLSVCPPPAPYPSAHACISRSGMNPRSHLAPGLMELIAAVGLTPGRARQPVQARGAGVISSISLFRTNDCISPRSLPGSGAIGPTLAELNSFSVFFRGRPWRGEGRRVQRR